MATESDEHATIDGEGLNAFWPDAVPFASRWVRHGEIYRCTAEIRRDFKTKRIVVTDDFASLFDITDIVIGGQTQFVSKGVVAVRAFRRYVGELLLDLDVMREGTAASIDVRPHADATASQVEDTLREGSIVFLGLTPHEVRRPVDPTRRLGRFVLPLPPTTIGAEKTLTIESEVFGRDWRGGTILRLLIAPANCASPFDTPTNPFDVVDIKSGDGARMRRVTEDPLPGFIFDTTWEMVGVKIHTSGKLLVTIRNRSQKEAEFVAAAFGIRAEKLDGVEPVAR
ncbi:MAG: hypothetical protein ACHREM_01070 [Polyangiales bacterium]